MTTINKELELVLKNDIGQYSLWKRGRRVPAGWSVVKEGSGQECRQYVDENWGRMRSSRTPSPEHT